ncbi:hypothetical protein A7A08_02667 [Methyloligella halotolerans]|uniref:Uncharacterized protein n=1 Tax=Methyloligella halotolerans TaxID=1177755 RepID=A0A1E2RWF5_9HYPH|nr:Ig-like domain-containing protein [Methyloligella halotolerans]ODA66543.1 hypothetical protein A7A08_02667 [Methyloligella halotolerans]
MGNKVVGIIVTVAFFVLVALVGYRLYLEQSETQEASAPPAVEEGDQAKAPEPADKAGEESAADTEASQEESATSEDDQAASSSDNEAQNATSGDDSASAGSADIPSFDVVRIEPTGEGVIAGRAEPAWGVEVQSNGTGIASTKADPAGQWSVVLDKPLGKGEHNLQIVATSPDGEKSLTSQQKVLVSMGDEESGKTVVALREPGKATEILQEDSAGGSGDESAANEDESASQQKMAAADLKDQSRPDGKDESRPDDGEKSASSETGSEGSSSAMGENDGGNDASSSAAKEDSASGGGASDMSASGESGDEASSDAASSSDEASSSDTVEAKQAGDETPALPEPPIRIKTVDYEDRGDQSGLLIVTGTSTKPSTDIMLYLDGELIGEGQTGADGDWKIEATKHLEPGNRALQIDLVNRAEDKILGRAAVGMRRQTPPPVAQEVPDDKVAKAEPEGSSAASKESGPAGGAGSGSASSAEGSSGSQGGEKPASHRVAGDRATSGASDMSALRRNRRRPRLRICRHRRTRNRKDSPRRTPVTFRIPTAHRARRSPIRIVRRATWRAPKRRASPEKTGRTVRRSTRCAGAIRSGPSPRNISAAVGATR